MGGRLSPEDDIWLSLKLYGIDPDELSPESVKQWKAMKERSQELKKLKILKLRQELGNFIKVWKLHI